MELNHFVVDVELLHGDGGFDDNIGDSALLILDHRLQPLQPLFSSRCFNCGRSELLLMVVDS